MARVHDQQMTTKTNTPVRTPRLVSPEMRELYKVLLKSEKFLNWGERKWQERNWRSFLTAEVQAEVIMRHFTPAQLARAWGTSVETIRAIFRHEPGVLKIGKPETRTKRAYITLRIPEEVAERVHQRLSA